MVGFCDFGFFSIVFLTRISDLGSRRGGYDNHTIFVPVAKILCQSRSMNTLSKLQDSAKTQTKETIDGRNDKPKNNGHAINSAA